MGPNGIIIWSGNGFPMRNFYLGVYVWRYGDLIGTFGEDLGV